MVYEKNNMECCYCFARNDVVDSPDNWVGNFRKRKVAISSLFEARS